MPDFRSPRFSGLPPVLGGDPAVLILGSFPSIQSLETGQYYANPLNTFWKIMEYLFGIDHTLPYHERTGLLVAKRIVLWDVIGSCRRTGSADSRIVEPSGNPITDLLQTRPGIRLIACNGSTAARLLQGSAIPKNVKAIRLPSTSPANARISWNEKCRSWSVLLDYV